MFDKRFHIKRKPYKIYGNEKTALELSEKAQRMLSVTDPIEIREYTDADENKHYDIYGVIECEHLSAEEVNEVLEQMATED